MSPKRQIVLALLLLVAAWVVVLVGWIWYGVVFFIDAALAVFEDERL